jgi:hypothetical protein
VAADGRPISASEDDVGVQLQAFSRRCETAGDRQDLDLFINDDLFILLRGAIPTGDRRLTQRTNSNEARHGDVVLRGELVKFSGYVIPWIEY